MSRRVRLGRIRAPARRSNSGPIDGFPSSYRQSQEQRRQRHAGPTRPLHRYDGKTGVPDGTRGEIPDIYWRSIDGDLQEQTAILGNPTHYLNAEKLLPKLGQGGSFAGKIPLAYLDAKKLYDSVSPGKSFFLDAGTAPWRAQQLADLYRSNLETFLSQPCGKLNSQQAALARTALTYAGLMSHFTGDASQPFHSTSDHDGENTGQRGVHWYFENHLVNALENELVGKVYRRAKMLLTAPASQKGFRR